MKVPDLQATVLDILKYKKEKQGMDWVEAAQAVQEARTETGVNF